MKIKIIYNKKKGAWGGANQFLMALESEFAVLDVLASTDDEANIFLINSYQNLLDFLKLKKQYPDKIFVHRLGPIFYYHRGFAWIIIDKIVINIANKIADFVFFQSNWSYYEAIKLGFDRNKKYAIIANASSSNVFKKILSDKNSDRKIKLVSDSWSKNLNKGFEYLKYLDENLNWNKYEMCFIGNSPIKFKNIKIIPVLSSENLAKELSKNDIFIAPYKDEACSNSIIEALNCGLPVVALKSGGNAELLENNGELFLNKEELLQKIELISGNYDYYKNKIKIFSIKEIASKYLDSIKQLSDSKRVKMSKINYLFFWFEILFGNFFVKILGIFFK